MNSQSKRQDVMSAILGAYVGIVLWITILGRHSTVEIPMPFSPFHSILSFVKEIKSNGLSGNTLGNILMFIPSGLLIPYMMKCVNWRKILVLGSLSSLIIEICQLITARGYFEIDDIILNTVGTAFGFVIFRHLLHKDKINEKDNESCNTN